MSLEKIKEKYCREETMIKGFKKDEKNNPYEMFIWQRVKTIKSNYVVYTYS